MSELSIGRKFLWLVTAPVKGARTEMQEWVRHGGFPLLVPTRIVEDRDCATVAAAMRITDRELDVLKALARFDHPQEVAEALHVATSTVYKHLEHLMSKLDVGSPHRLVLAALSCGLLTMQQCP
jgi:DNA-binding CsgD family transcriptional regulator